jgi:hypothetical protein
MPADVEKCLTAGEALWAVFYPEAVGLRGDVAWVAIRSVVMIVAGWLLIMVLLPAALVAAGT